MRMKAKEALRWTLVAFVLLTPAAASAQACPDAPDDPIARRALAKEWFSKAESSETGGDREAAVKQYACSLRLVPHPATAYNLGTAAERSGDLSLASDAFRAYLKLLPDAPDRSHIEARVARLDADVAELRRQIVLETPPAASTAKPTSGRDPGASSPPLLTDDRRFGDARPNRYRTAGWVMLGSGTGALATGVVFNLLARDKMKTCRDPDLPTAQANDACDIARPLAYGSYAFFGLGAALAATGLGVLLWGGGSTDVSIAPASVPGGTALVMSGRF